MAAPDTVTSRTQALAHLSVGGLGDDLAAAALRKSAVSLLACGVAELTVDLSSLDDAYPSFLHTLATLTATARAHSCKLFLIGVHSPAVLTALDDAPLDVLFAIYEAACRHDTTSTTAVPPGSGRSGQPWRVPEQARVTSASAQSPVASAVHGGGPAEATGAPRHARTEARTSPTPTNEGALMVSIHTTEATYPEWIDRLVDLHVLAAHGDTDAAIQADQWMAEDPDVRRVWDRVARTCELLHAPSA